ncbi:site-specific integrase [Diplocloster hominis]|uniref:tyrosine-type recombinase/integrase n=1 Tax=Diplocloster hominis TaxID=3079010 RepID=UPI0031BA9656
MKKENIPTGGPRLTKEKPKAKRHLRLPNGYGSIVTLSQPERRRNPFMVRPPVTRWKDNGHPIYDPPIGYYPTWMEAFEALVEWHKKPYDTNDRNMTFEEVYRLFFAYKYEDPQKPYSKSSIDCAKAGFKNSATLHKKAFYDLKADDLQAVIDNCPLKHASLEHIKNLFRQMYEYAMRYDLASKNWAEFVEIKTPDDDESGIPFTQEEMNVLWANLAVPWVDTILILCYSGFRLEGMRTVQINLEEGYFKGGVKTKAGKGRIVPIHSRIVPLVEKRVAEYGTIIHVAQETYRKYFYEIMKTLQFDHTPHDCRTTFATMGNRAGMPKPMLKRLMGHTLAQDITEAKYISPSLDDLREAIEMID